MPRLSPGNCNFQTYCSPTSMWDSRLYSGNRWHRARTRFTYVRAGNCRYPILFTGICGLRHGRRHATPLFRHRQNNMREWRPSGRVWYRRPVDAYGILMLCDTLDCLSFLSYFFLTLPSPPPILTRSTAITSLTVSPRSSIRLARLQSLSQLS